MARLDFNLHGYRFQQGLTGLSRGFASATAALAADLLALEHEQAAYAAHLAAGGSPIGEWDGAVQILSQDDILRLRIEDAGLALMDLRKAYVLAGYHHWERSAQSWTGRPKGQHKELTDATLALGYPVDPRLQGVCDLANTLKHNSTTKARRLAVSWPGLLRLDPSGVTHWDWYAELQLTDSDIAQAFEVLGRSGPTVRHDLDFTLAAPVQVGRAPA